MLGLPSFKFIFGSLNTHLIIAPRSAFTAQLDALSTSYSFQIQGLRTVFIIWGTPTLHFQPIVAPLPNINICKRILLITSPLQCASRQRNKKRERSLGTPSFLPMIHRPEGINSVGGFAIGIIPSTQMEVKMDQETVLLLLPIRIQSLSLHLLMRIPPVILGIA